MRIFGKTVVGLFDNDQDVDKALKLLQEAGFGDKDDDQIEIVDETRLPQETPVEEPGSQVVAPSAAGSGQTGGVVVPTPADMEDSGGLEAKVKKMLDSMGVGNKEGSYFAQQVARHGSKLVIVDTDSSRAKQALEVMKQVPSRALIS